MPETQSTTVVVVVEMQMTRLTLTYTTLGFSIRVCVSLSAACAELYKLIFYSLTFTVSSPSPTATPQSSLTPVLQTQHWCRTCRLMIAARQTNLVFANANPIYVYVELLLSISLAGKPIFP